MSITIENEFLQASFHTVGAELYSLKHKKASVEYIWQGNPEFWGRHAPVLFPFVGRLKHDTYRYQGQTYPMSQHGFARDHEFTVTAHGASHATFSLTSSPETKAVYPFDFELLISYQLEEQTLTVTYEVRNLGEELYFSIGGHPAFNVPLVPNTKFTDYYIRFHPSKSRLTLPLSGPYVDFDNRTLAQTNTNINLNRRLFENDAFILETVGKNSFSILSEKTSRSVALSYDNMPYVGIWSPYPKEAPFVCIEPWCGVADTVDASGNIEEKLGINHLTAGQHFICSYAITVN